MSDPHEGLPCYVKRRKLAMTPPTKVVVLDCFYGYWVVRKVQWFAGEGRFIGVVVGSDMLPLNWMIIPIGSLDGTTGDDLSSASYIP